MLKSLPYKFIILVLLYFAIDFTIDSINHNLQLNDFRVYYNASSALMSKHAVYNELFALGSGYYKYAPFTAILFYPLTFLPYNVACILQFIAISISISLLSLISYKLFNEHFFRFNIKSPDLLLSLSVLSVGTHFHREFILGNVNALLLSCLTLCIYLLLKGKDILAGLLLAFVVITKPFFALLFIPLLLYKYYRTLISSILFLFIFFLFTTAICGISHSIELHEEWLKTILLHSSAFPSSNSIQSLLTTYFYSGIPKYLQYIVLAFILGVYSVLAWKNSKAPKPEREKQCTFIIAWFALIALMPLLFNTDTEHFLMTFPLIIFLWGYSLISKKTLFIIILISCILMYNGNSTDILGEKLSHRINDLGILGISNAFLIALAIIAFTRYSKLIQEPQTL